MIYWKYVCTKKYPFSFLIIKVGCYDNQRNYIKYRAYKDLNAYKDDQYILEDEYYYENNKFIDNLSISQSFEEMENELNNIYLLKEII